MGYVTGFMAAVPLARKDDYVAHSKAAWPIFQKYGALRCVECWGDDVPMGEHTSFPRAVKAEEGETVVMGWIEWPDKASCDACTASMQTDPAWREMGEMPFDGARMIFGGFEQLLDLKA